MSPLWALLLLTWAAMIILFLGLGAVLREVRMLRAQIDAAAATGERVDIELPASVAGGRGGLVLAVDSGCPLCIAVVQRVGSVMSGPDSAAAVLLTFEPEKQWNGLTGGLPVVRDERAWSAIAHLSTPILLQVDGQGRVRRLHLPANERDVTPVLQSWGLLSQSEKNGRANAA
ncbi:hypothetical protein FHR83_002177 [Actinoplanes campanulatus]|uniref:Thioredoxin domain-containing protein n=1 Tax=Actinoplanes campanulatus TaxID=113559 RepID=A0A7W5FDN5_9ACTN|nr:hypothetical protein [Actinoplanes campanulatus]MBB3094525.1 hypothetical protein [Actinoplanes campanulatus]GGN21674.1 hypothetical protein GCM10010109_35910 [Actinoplanes campanulatus]GID35559.1 hypothetical protein Aca09nite_20650 [Actinoplanes campanulatus]